MGLNPSKLNISGILARTAGAVGTGLVLFDCNNAAKEHSHMYSVEKKTEDIQNRYFDTLTLSSPSVVRDTVKKKLLGFSLDENISPFFHSVAGYFHGLGEMLLDNVVPLGLSVGAMIGPKGLISKTCGVGLLIYGACFAAQEFFRVGKQE